MSEVAAQLTFAGTLGISEGGRKYAFATASSCTSTLAVNGRLPAEPGTTCNPYIRVHCTSGDDPTKTYSYLDLWRADVRRYHNIAIRK